MTPSFPGSAWERRACKALPEFLFPGSAWEHAACKAPPCGKNQPGKTQIRQAEPASSAFPGGAWERELRGVNWGVGRRGFARIARLIIA